MANLNFSQSLANYLDALRTKKNMTQEDFTNGIVSMRQYRRYLRGESDVAPYVFDQFAERLGLNIEYLVFEFRGNTFRESKLANDYHNAVINHNVEKVTSLKKQFNPETITEPNHLLIYEYATALFSYNSNQMAQITLIEKLKSLLNYPNILKHHAFSSTEIIILSSLLVYDECKEKDKIVKVLSDALNHKSTIISGNNQKIMLLCLYRLADYHKRYGDPSSMLQFASKGIQACKELKYHYLLEDFYLFAALAYQRLNEPKQISSMLSGLYNVLQFENDLSKTKRYQSYLFRDFNIEDFDDYILKYLSHK